MATFKDRVSSFNMIIPLMEAAFLRSVETAHSDMAKRIFEEGGNSAGNKIGSYAATTKKYRKQKNRQIAFVDLKLTGQLQKDFSNTLFIRNPYFIQLGVKNIANAIKVKHLTDRYGNIFKLTQEENLEHKRILGLELNAILKQVISGK
ncbi:MAG: hypothetical protein EOP53_12675 [Sphingobacteriales bacterium]|nr:MAG: hypothetical protein EOP53_12675 [Sphingobacteriales bacterium]